MEETKKISDRHKAVVDELMVNGLNRKKAYESVYKSTGLVSARSCYIMLQRPEVQEYFNEQRENLLSTVSMDKQGVVLKLMSHIEGFDDLTSLASQDKLSEQEYMKFNRLEKLYSQAGSLKAFELIGKLTGLFEPEKVQVEHIEYKVDFS
jgi:hypothetical protein